MYLMYLDYTPKTLPRALCVLSHSVIYPLLSLLLPAIIIHLVFANDYEINSDAP